MIDIIFSAGRLSIPILFAAYGGLLSERSGIANIALEGCLMFSAFAAATTVALSGSLSLGVVAGILASSLLSGLFAAVCIWGRGDQIVMGIGINLLVLGLIPVVNHALFGVTGSTPNLPATLTFHAVWPFFVLAIAMGLGLEFLVSETRLGLRIVAAGENPAALITQGLSSRQVQLKAVVVGGLLTGVGGLYLSLCQGSGYVREMSAGRGFIALAAIILGGWKPIPTFFAAIFFALCDALQIQLQGKQWGEWTFPNQLVQILPYVITLVVLAFYTRKMVPPAAINRADFD